jgi:hypothetical protein
MFKMLDSCIEKQGLIVAILKRISIILVNKTVLEQRILLGGPLSTT